MNPCFFGCPYNPQGKQSPCASPSLPGASSESPALLSITCVLRPTSSPESGRHGGVSDVVDASNEHRVITCASRDAGLIYRWGDCESYSNTRRGALSARAAESESAKGLKRIGVDEFSYLRRNNYITIVVDHDKKLCRLGH